MSQGPLCPNLSQKVQKEVSQMANCNLSCAMLYRWFKCKLKPPNNSVYRIISKEEEREDPRRDSSIYLRVQWCFHIPTRATVFLHAIQ